jgi:hypothetical protein
MNPRSRILTSLLLLLGLVAAQPMSSASELKIMLLTGQSSKYHDWTKSSPLVKQQLEATGLFAVDVVTTPARGGDMSGFAPDFSSYAAVVMIYEGDDWPAATREAFTAYMKNGGGLVVIHDTDNAFPFWPEWNEMIGLGGWGLKPDGNVGARDESWGPKLRWRDGHQILDDSPGRAGHPPRHDFLVVTRAPDHPVMKGLPAAWLHPDDEIYSQLRGPAKNVEILATAKADPARFPKSSGEHEPMLMAVHYGRGRVFHTTLGHVGPTQEPPFKALLCVGHIVTLQRGTEWAATGRVTQPVPDDFPSETQAAMRVN